MRELRMAYGRMCCGMHVFVKATVPLAVVVLTTGVYLAFAGGWWEAAGPVVSLVLFALGGVAATVLVDPRVARLRAVLNELPDGLVTPEMGIRHVDPTLRHTTIVRRLTATERERVVIIGGGPAGLAAAAVLKRRHIDALALEQASEIGASWQVSAYGE